MESKYTFDENKITAQFISEEYILIAFEGTSGVSRLYISSVYNPETVYWYINITADNILSINEDVNYYYLALDDATYSGAKIEKLSPTTIDYFTKDVGITEKSVDFITDATFIYFLIPGELSATNAKIAKYNLSTEAYVETIDLATVDHAKKIDIDGDDVIWVIDEDNNVTKVWNDGSWNYTVYAIIL